MQLLSKLEFIGLHLSVESCFFSKCMQKCTVYIITSSHFCIALMFLKWVSEWVHKWCLQATCHPRLRQCSGFVIMHIFSSTVTQVFKTIRMKPAQNLSSQSKWYQVVLKKTQLTIQHLLSRQCPPTNVNNSLFSGTVSNNVWRQHSSYIS